MKKPAHQIGRRRFLKAVPAAVAAGVQPILVLTGDGESARWQWDGNAPVVPTIWEAAELILSANGSGAAAGDFTGLLIHNFDTEIFSIRITIEHSLKHRCPVLSFGAAGPGIDRYNRS